ncbi:MAG: hypothetical protein NC115_08590 [Bacteroidales bacterium]|nr:hypothetical protein [Bacteroidales bacterium]
MDIVNDTQHEIEVTIESMRPLSQNGYPEGYTIAIRPGDTFKYYDGGEESYIFDIFEAEVVFDGKLKVIHDNEVQEEPEGFRNMCRRENWDACVIKERQSGKGRGGIYSYTFTFESVDYEYALSLTGK